MNYILPKEFLRAIPTNIDEKFPTTSKIIQALEFIARYVDSAFTLYENVETIVLESGSWMNYMPDTDDILLENYISNYKTRTTQKIKIRFDYIHHICLKSVKLSPEVLIDESLAELSGVNFLEMFLMNPKKYLDIKEKKPNHPRITI